jgi:hypothetical protein
MAVRRASAAAVRGGVRHFLTVVRTQPSGCFFQPFSRAAGDGVYDFTEGPIRRSTWRGMTMAKLAHRLSGRVDRIVVDKAGMAGRSISSWSLRPIQHARPGDRGQPRWRSAVLASDGGRSSLQRCRGRSAN